VSSLLLTSKAFIEDFSFRIFPLDTRTAVVNAIINETRARWSLGTAPSAHMGRPGARMTQVKSRGVI
jgi:hypothetical protein